MNGSGRDLEKSKGGERLGDGFGLGFGENCVTPT